MKNQYFGDVGDYGKYGLLRFFAERDVSIAVNWYLTEDDGSSDGKHITYLEKNEYFKYDPTLYVHLREYVLTKKKRAVSLIEESGLVEGAVYYSEIIENPMQYVKKERDRIRKEWHNRALSLCGGRDLIFLDPDNGFKEKPPSKVKDQLKYCYADEVSDYYNSGSNVFFYTTKGRRTPDQWQAAKNSMKNATPDAAMMGLTFHRGTQRSYIFAVHPEDAGMYQGFLDTFLNTNWKDMFTVEEM